MRFNGISFHLSAYEDEGLRELRASMERSLQKQRSDDEDNAEDEAGPSGSNPPDEDTDEDEEQNSESNLFNEEWLSGRMMQKTWILKHPHTCSPSATKITSYKRLKMTYCLNSLTLQYQHDDTLSFS